MVLIGSPRREGNSAALAAAVVRGARAAGVEADSAFIDDHVAGFLRDCRRCRGPDGACTIGDGYRRLFFERFLPAAGVVFCTPIYWYGMSAQTKAFFDRSFCYYAASFPGSAEVIAAMSRKRIGLAIASEETYPGAALGIVHQVQEYARYTRSAFVGVVRGVGNSRGEVARDPAGPLAEAERLGRELLTRPYTDYHIDTPRRGRVWGDADQSAPPCGPAT
ncbi:MAG: flavodoxin family protein [Planctomycetes bacterium]|nr:flavodoxin family protein [Planctomycetota bacterium]